MIVRLGKKGLLPQGLGISEMRQRGSSAPQFKGKGKMGLPTSAMLTGLGNQERRGIEASQLGGPTP